MPTWLRRLWRYRILLVERRDNCPILLHNKKGKIECLSPILPVGDDFDGIVGDRKRQAECRIAMHEFHDNFDLAELTDRPHAYRDAIKCVSRYAQGQWRAIRR